MLDSRKDIQMDMKPGDAWVIFEQKVTLVQCSASRDDGFPDKYDDVVLASSAYEVEDHRVADTIKQVLKKAL